MPHTPTSGGAMLCYWVYILASQPRGTLYIGITNNILGRVELHRAGKGSGFTTRYGVSMLVHFEEFASVDEAIQREKTLKRYLRDSGRSTSSSSRIRSGSTFTLALSRAAAKVGQAASWVLGTSPRMTPRVSPGDWRQSKPQRLYRCIS